MLQTISKICVKEEKIDEFIKLFKKMIAPTKKENGYIEYDIYQDEKVLSTFIVLEKWESRKDFDKHLESKHFKEIVPEMMELMTKETEVNLAYKIE